MANELYRQLDAALCSKSFLRQAGMTKKRMKTLWKSHPWKRFCSTLAQDPEIGCREILRVIRPVLNDICPEPEEGWLQYTFDRILLFLYPDAEVRPSEETYRTGCLVFCEILHTVLAFNRMHRDFSPIRDFAMLSPEEYEKWPCGEEYQRMMTLVRQHYLYEFMKIGAEITPFNTLGHVAGVHYTAMCIAMQLAQTDVPVDLAMVSAVAASHDIGKFGCKKSEASRVPHLHYYYTDQCLTRLGLPLVAHIASNHSTWDLELENLSVESLILIYADFRVKSSRRADGTEQIHFYTLADAFDVILNKLEHVDEKKRARYVRVYAKLHDFESYLRSIGISVDLSDGVLRPRTWKDRALLRNDEAVERLKYLAIEHNIRIMSLLSDEMSFANLLEDARSEKQWKNIRAYLNILKEYGTYMTFTQKQMTIHFLSEQLVNREGDIRRQAAKGIGELIACYDERRTKEVPEGAVMPERRITGEELWKEHLDRILIPDLQRTERQQRWMGYSLKITLISLLDGIASLQEKRQYLACFLETLSHRNMSDATVFILLDTILDIPMALCEAAELRRILGFCRRAMRRETLEVRVAVLRVLKSIAVSSEPGALDRRMVNQMHSLLRTKVAEDKMVSVVYLKVKTREALGSCGDVPESAQCELDELEEDMPDIFSENLKVGTPWTIKAVNIEVMLDELEKGKRAEVFYIAAHLSNLLKVSERVTVRHIAGRGLIRLFDLLSWEQRNEIVIELTRGLEIGEYQFSKYIPQYLGVLIARLRSEELDEILRQLQSLLENSNDKVVSVTLETLGVILNEGIDDRRKKKAIGMMLRGMANYHPAVSQEAFWVLGQKIFGSGTMSLEHIFDIFRMMHKKMLTLIKETPDQPLMFFNNAASLNHIYRYISDHEFFLGKMQLPENDKAAFFPGTFDPFSSGHKGIVTAIREMGYEVYLALDEFSWSKNTQARMHRKKIMEMSCADETSVYIFPDNEPVNIANAADIRKLKNILNGKEVYVVMGSDVIANASSYRIAPEPDSIHSMNHIVFRRESLEQSSRSDRDYEAGKATISGELVELTLPTHLEDVSSSRIRHNIDQNRDISSLLDPVAQKYIYDNALYLREPMYKSVLETKDLRYRYQKKNGVLQRVIITEREEKDRIVAQAELHPVTTAHLYDEFGEQELAASIRENALGRILIIKEICVSYGNEEEAFQWIITETLAEALKEEFTYAVYHPEHPDETSEVLIRVLMRQGFRRMVVRGKKTEIYAVDMHQPVVLIQNMGTVLKAPLNKSPRIEAALTDAHHRLQTALTRFYPGTLVLSFDSTVMYHKLIRKITKENGVPPEPRKKRRQGPYMCVPFGKILNGMAVPNTVTKTLHMQKTFFPDLSSFKISEYPYYASIPDQVRTIHSFHRPVILVDDLLHKGYRIRSLDPILRENDVPVQKIIVGIESGGGKDLMKVQGRDVDSVYFIPNLKAWFVDSSLYPFIGGDGLERHTGTMDDAYTAINLIMPYVTPPFLKKDADHQAIYSLSLVCLENARDILTALEEEYQLRFQRKLTLQRLSEVIAYPKLTDVGRCLDFDRSIAASAYVEDDIERLKRLRVYVQEEEEHETNQ